MHKLVEGLHHFRSSVFPAKKDFFAALAEGQRPETLFITCSDSRINPNLLTHTEPGDLFILRNAGNIVPPWSDAPCGEAATIEFAVQQLGVAHIVVCGHARCGAMTALLRPEATAGAPAVARWLEHAQPTRRLVAEHYADLDFDRQLNVLVQENVLAQVEALRTHPCVETRLARGDLSIHAWVYKIDHGTVFQYDIGSGQFTQIEGAMRPAEAYVRRGGALKSI
jgi:carbonic anhydrase